MTKEIKQNAIIGAAPRKVYAALIEEKRHAKFTGEPATISRKVGGAFSCYGGWVQGINLDLVPGKRIVQAWRGKNWPAGAYSLVTFALARAKGGKTRIRFTHVGVPSSKAKDINNGWKNFYWKPLRAYLGK
jgi:uncharacterized protein YndB with AHSA1/START domain